MDAVFGKRKNPGNAPRGPTSAVAPRTPVAPAAPAARAAPVAPAAPKAPASPLATPKISAATTKRRPDLGARESGDEGDLMASIRAGAKLKKASSRNLPPPQATSSSTGGPMEGATTRVQARMDVIRSAISGDDDEEDGEEDDDYAVEDWQ